MCGNEGNKSLPLYLLRPSEMRRKYARSFPESETRRLSFLASSISAFFSRLSLVLFPSLLSLCMVPSFPLLARRRGTGNKSAYAFQRTDPRFFLSAPYLFV